MLGGSVAGTQVSERTALQVAAVYGSIGVISDAVTTLPVELVSSKDAAKRKVLPPSPLVTEPYAEISRMDWWGQFVMSLALRGNFYGEIIERDKKTLYPTQIKPIHPDRASVRRNQSGQIEYRFNSKIVPIQDVFHVRLYSVAGSLEGLNPIEYLRNPIGVARAQDLWGASWFANSAIPAGVIEVEGELDPDETLALAKEWISAHQGIGQANLPAVLTGGASFKGISINPEDSQFLESKQFSQSEISGMIFRVPPHMIGLVERSTSWGRGIEQQERGFVANTLSGYLVRGEEALTKLHPPGQFVEFNLRARIKGDKLETAQASSLGMLGGWLCADDARAEESRAPLPGGEGKNVFSPINTELLKEAMLQVEAAKVAKEKAEKGEEQQPQEDAPPEQDQ